MAGTSSNPYNGVPNGTGTYLQNTPILPNDAINSFTQLFDTIGNQTLQTLAKLEVRKAREASPNISESLGLQIFLAGRELTSPTQRGRTLNQGLIGSGIAEQIRTDCNEAYFSKKNDSSPVAKSYEATLALLLFTRATAELVMILESSPISIVQFFPEIFPYINAGIAVSSGIKPTSRENLRLHMEGVMKKFLLLDQAKQDDFITKAKELWERI